MNKKVIVSSLIALCVFMAGCTNKQTKQVNAVASNNKQDTTIVSPTKKDTSSPVTILKSQIYTTVTQDEALNIVSKIVGVLPNGNHLDFDHMQTVDNKEYYVIHHYEVVVDSQKTGDSHTVTYEWYYVDIVKGNVYKLDVPSNTLTKVDEEKTKPVKEQQITYKKYANTRYGFSIEYPSTFVTKVIPDNNDGIMLASPDGTVELTISGINNVLNETAISSYNELIKNHSNASYKNQQGNWFVVSWMEGDKIVYEKGVVGKGSSNSFVIKYPLTQKKAYDSIVSHLNSTFKTPSIVLNH